MISFAEKEFEPEFEIALSEDLFDRPCFNCSASERIDLDDSPASADLLAQSVHSMALANAEFVHLPARELLLEQPQIILFDFRKPQTLGLQYSHRGHEAWEKLAVEFGSAVVLFCILRHCIDHRPDQR
jgi:hypothetical protein